MSVIKRQLRPVMSALALASVLAGAAFGQATSGSRTPTSGTPASRVPAATPPATQAYPGAATTPAPSTAVPSAVSPSQLPAAPDFQQPGVVPAPGADTLGSVGTAAGSYDQNSASVGGENATRGWVWLLLLALVGGVAYYFMRNRQEHDPAGGSRGGKGGAV